MPGCRGKVVYIYEGKKRRGVFVFVLIVVWGGGVEDNRKDFQGVI